MTEIAVVRAGALLILAGLIGARCGAEGAPICPDRPSKGTGTCTVPAGAWQIETALVDWTHDRSNGETTDLTLIGTSLIKYGISDRADVEVGVTPYESLRAPGDRARGFGDTLVRTKVSLTSQNSKVQVAVDPFVKLPTAKHDLGNGKIEAGMTIPMAIALGQGPFSVAIAPEVDWLTDADGHGHHIAMIQLIDLGIQPSPKVSLTAELWGQWDWDPAGTGKQASADGAIAYLVSKSMQIDSGANFGLNRQTPDVELYAGVSKRF